jgi:hypothetical protein
MRSYASERLTEVNVLVTWKQGEVMLSVLSGKDITKSKWTGEGGCYALSIGVIIPYGLCVRLTFHIYKSLAHAATWRYRHVSIKMH